MAFGSCNSSKPLAQSHVEGIPGGGDLGAPLRFQVQDRVSIAEPVILAGWILSDLGSMTRMMLLNHLASKLGDLSWLPALAMPDQLFNSCEEAGPHVSPIDRLGGLCRLDDLQQSCMEWPERPSSGDVS